jgi:hypothetical protein
LVGHDAKLGLKGGRKEKQCAGDQYPIFNTECPMSKGRGWEGRGNSRLRAGGDEKYPIFNKEFPMLKGRWGLSGGGTF